MTFSPSSNKYYNNPKNYYSKVKINGQRSSFSKPKNLNSLSKLQKNEKYKIDNNRKNHHSFCNKKVHNRIISNGAEQPKVLKVKKLQLVKISLADEEEDKKINDNSSFNYIDKHKKRIRYNKKSFNSSDEDEENNNKGRTQY